VLSSSLVSQCSLNPIFQSGPLSSGELTSFFFLFQGSGKKQLRPDLPPVAIEIRSVLSLVLEKFFVTTFHALSVWF
jgi:hypothetical protein